MTVSEKSESIPETKGLLDAQRSYLAAWLDSTPAKVTGFGIAVAATVVTAMDSISRGFFKSMNKAGAFTDLQEMRDAAIAEVLDQAKRDEPVKVIDEVEKIHGIYTDRLTQRMRTLQVNSTWDKWRVIKPHQRMEVLMTTGAVATVALGALLTIATGRDIVQKQDEMERENEDRQRGR